MLDSATTPTTTIPEELSSVMIASDVAATMTNLSTTQRNLVDSASYSSKNKFLFPICTVEKMLQQKWYQQLLFNLIR